MSSWVTLVFHRCFSEFKALGDSFSGISGFPLQGVPLSFQIHKGWLTLSLRPFPLPSAWGNLTLATCLKDQGVTHLKQAFCEVFLRRASVDMPIRDLMTTVAFAKHALMFRISSRKFLYGPCRPIPPSSQVFKSFLWTLLMVSCGTCVCFFLFHNIFLLVLFYLLVWQRKIPYCKPQNQGSEKKKWSTLCLETMRKQTHVCGMWIHTFWCGQVRASWLEEGTRGSVVWCFLLLWLFWGARHPDLKWITWRFVYS